MSDLAVGIDVAPLAQSRAGTARHIESLTAALEVEGGVRLRRYSFGGPGRATAAARDVWWYLVALAERARRDGVDVLHCPTFRAPVRSSIPLVVTFMQEGVVPRLPTAVLSMGLMLLAFLSIACGLVLDTVTRGRRELKLLAYLAQRAPAEERRRS